MGHTMREVATRAGVSKATVSRVLSKTHSIAPETERRVLEVVRQLNYHKNVHARRLATVGNLLDSALDRMERVVHFAEQSPEGRESSRLSADQVRFIREEMAAVRARLHEGLRHFSVRLQRPEPKQMLIAELSSLWVILENARPERLKGYGLEFSPQDKADWEDLIQALLQGTETIRGTVLQTRSKV